MTAVSEMPPQVMKRIKGKHIFLGSLTVLLVVLYFRIFSKSSCGLEYLNDQSFNHVFEYCNSVKQKRIAQEGIVPDEYTLVSVHVVIRHGDRHRLHTIDNYEDIQVHCKINENHIKEMPEMAEYEHFMRRETKMSKRPPGKSFSNWELFPDKDWCSPGDLTPMGAAQHVKNGLLMRRRYINNLDLLNLHADIHKQILIRSTLWSRTYQSALALLFGLLTNYNITQLNIETTDPSLCYPKASELTCDCPLTTQYRDVMSATYHQMHPEVMDNIQTRNVIKHFAEVFDISPKNVPKLSQLMDIGMVHICQKNNLPQPKEHNGKCTKPWAIRDIYDIIQDNGRRQAKSPEFQKIAKIKYLPLLLEIKKRLVEQAHEENDVKFVLYSGHDSTINPLAIALNFSEGHWPPYASRIVIELYKSKNIARTGGSEDLFVKFLFNGLSVGGEVTFCKKHVTNSGLCPLNVFITYVDNLLKELSETSYQDACKISL